MYKKIVYKYHSLERTITDSEKVKTDFMYDISHCQPSNISIYKTVVRVAFSGEKYTCLYTLPARYATYIETGKALREAYQYIADVYHCSDCWGEKITDNDMLVSLQEWEKEKNPGDYSPAPVLYKECATYWNELCDMYPN